MTPDSHHARTIEILVSPTGGVQIKAVGFTGSSCRDATRLFERALGVAGPATLLPEYFATQPSTENQQLRQGG